MPRPIPYKFRLVYFFAFALVFLIGFPIIVFYSAGYTFDMTLGLTVRGGIYVSAPEPGTSVFIGNELRSTSGFFKKEVLVNNLKPAQYLVFVTNDKFWPWAKVVNVKPGEVEPLAPFLVPKVVSASEIKPTDEGYKEALALFVPKATSSAQTVAKTQSTQTSALVTTSTASSGVATSTFETVIHKSFKIWKNENTIYAQWVGSVDATPKYFCIPAVTKNAPENCASPIQVFHSDVPIRTFDFYPTRDDAIVLALDNGIYAVEIDPRTYQNFYPIYRGQEPDFRVSKGLVYIKDKNFLASLSL